MKVYLASDVYMVILNHALSTEVEEIMGLLFGENNEDGDLYIFSLCILQRRDKRKDRVEIAPEQLSEAMDSCDRVSADLGIKVRVIGWYHSHPHITAFPSEVDIRTQLQYQAMDANFVGLILALYCSDKFQTNTMDLIFFRSQSSPEHGMQYNLLPFHIFEPNEECKPKLSTNCLQSLSAIPKIILKEEKEAFENAQEEVGQFPMICAHNVSVYTKSVCKVTEGLVLPILRALKDTTRAAVEQSKNLKVNRK